MTFAGAGQDLDTGAKVVHVGKNTSSYMNTRSISKSGGVSTFRSSVVVEKERKGREKRGFLPVADARFRIALGHHPRHGHQDARRRRGPRGQDRRDQQRRGLFYLMSRGMSEEDARALIVSGFADNVSKELPLEYAVEMNNLIRLEMKGSIG